MNQRPAAVLLAITVLAGALPAFAQAPRQDSFWARKATGPITLDGILNEAEWAKAESMTVRWATDSGIPGSGWKAEGGILPQDPTRAVIKLLVVGNQMYLGARVPDQSIGGSKDFNRFDGFLMSIKDHSSPDAPKPPAEYTYVWWYPTTTDPQPPGQSPAFIGKWATWPPGTARTPTQIANWDAVTVVHGTSNTDATNDTDYTVEMRFNLTPMGYDVTQPNGDVVEWNISVYDCDWLWPINVARLSYNRVWWQGPWANDIYYDEVHVFAKPSVTTSSGALPTIAPEYTIPDGLHFVAPTVDGNLNDPIWSVATSFDIRYGDSALRQTYGGVGPSRAGQYQPPVNGGQAAVLDPSDATVKMVWKDRKLFLGFDVRDQVVQYHPSFDRWDGALISIDDRKQRSPDNVLMGRRLSFQVGANGAAVPQDYLLTLVQSGGAQVAVQLNPGTTVDTLGASPDNGYKAEVAIDLTKVGYPLNLGDRTLFIGIDMLDGDSFVPITDSYGTRTWWFREYEGRCCPTWAYMALSPIVDSGEPPEDQTDGFVLLGAAPNPSLHSTIRYSLPRSSLGALEVYDVSGRVVERRKLGMQAAGEQSIEFDGSGLAAGMYLYRIELTDPSTGAARRTLTGRIVVVK